MLAIVPATLLGAAAIAAEPAHQTSIRLDGTAGLTMDDLVLISA